MHIKPAASIADILTPRRAKATVAPACCISCGSKLTGERVKALKGLNTPFELWTCVKCASLVTTPRLGIFMGEVGTSELKIVDKIYSDSVRDIFTSQDNHEPED